MSLSAVSIVEVTRGLAVGGAERALLLRLARVKELGFPVTSVVWNTNPVADALTGSLRSSGIEVVESPLRSLRGMVRFCREARRLGFTRVVVHSPSDAVIIGLLKILHFIRTPIIFNTHSEKTKRINRLLLRWINRAYDVHIADADAVARGPLCRGARNIHVVYLGTVAPNELPTARPQSQPVSCVILGRLIPLKRYDWAIRAISDARNSLGTQAALLVIGDGPMRQNLEDLSAALEVGAQFLGVLEQPAKVLNTCDLLIISSEYEGLPLTLFEALVHGLRVVSTDVGGIRTLCADSGSVTLAPSDDYQAFSLAVTSAIHTGDFSIEGKKARAKEWEWLHQPKLLAEFYEAMDIHVSGPEDFR